MAKKSEPIIHAEDDEVLDNDAMETELAELAEAPAPAAASVSKRTAAEQKRGREVLAARNRAAK